MAVTARASKPAIARRSAQRDFASNFFHTLNSVVEPVVRTRCFSPNLFAPTGLIVLETTGRRSGKSHQTPVFAMLMDGHLIVRTFRGERSEWFKNLRKNPDVAYWTRGEKKAARAVIHAPGEECQIE